ncbi:exodeoxyribonuclease V subunit gamma [Nocardioides zeae]|uniref:RecBCD enzyme subunit RecC n=1 Tax=Nocardioides imazamoxiresistens TaxID=3231893 RepID=A0ABU3PVY2_9ACTN|nr:exodeoxyribonuclease V subunit gamma [Nocardioides zeae]MDT9593390.1 exodeoxyribonuclease V subunit gamma [Nocardioides zeae]
MTLTVHRASRTDELAAGLGALLARPAPGADPFADELVVVPARGVERWLAQRLSHDLGAGPRGGDGVCAGVRFLSPASLASLLVGREQDDPWDPARLTWPVLAAIDAHLHEEWCAPLARHLGAIALPGDTPGSADLRRGRRWSVARRVAGLLGSYAAQRPHLVAAWRAGDDVDGAGGQVPDDLRWQPELLRRVVAAVDAAPPDERHAAALERLRAGADDLPLPARVSLFGHTRLPTAELELLEALAATRDVHLWLPVASPVLARRLDAIAAPAGPRRRDEDTSARAAAHPLLAALGRDARELQQRLAAVDGVRTDDLDDLPEPSPAAPVLQLLQADVRADRVPTAEQRAERARDVDDSVQVHSCHGPARQVEVLREVLVGMLADDPTLEPRDVLVMCPDVETYAPLVEAGFGLGDDPTAGGAAGGGPDGGPGGSSAHERHPAHRLRVRLADRALSSVNPLLALAERLVALAGGRVTASEVLDLAAQPVVRRRFGLDEDDLDRVGAWVRDAGVRWGLDAEHRAAYRLEGVGQNTWRAGLDRVLLGATMPGEGGAWVGSALPLDDVDSNDADLAGRVAELVDRLASVLDGLAGPRPAGEWAAHLAAGVDLLAAVAPPDAWQSAELDRELARLVPLADGAPVALPDVRAMLARQWGGRPTRAGFRTGTLTVATLVPMRSVPHRVVCLLGVDDGVFPRATVADGDDVLARTPLLGERDPRSEDRQLLLDAVMAAGERLVVLYTGAGEHTGGARPPSVPVGELVTAVHATAPIARPVVTAHPLQPFDAANLRPGSDDERALTPAGRGPLSFDAAALAGALAARGPRSVPWPLVREPLPPRRPATTAGAGSARGATGAVGAGDPGTVDLDDLVRFLVHPMKEFLRTRLDVATRFDADEVVDAIPLELDGLGRWGVGSRLLADALAEVHPDDAREAERRRAQLPPRALGDRVLDAAVGDVRELHLGTRELRTGEARTLEVDVDLGDLGRLVGTVGGVHGGNLVTVDFSSLKAKQRLTAWVRLLALSASHPDRSFVAHTVGRAGRAGPKRAIAGPLDHRALEWLRDLVELRERGLREPLPLPLRTGCAVAEGIRRQRAGDDVPIAEVARREWVTGFDAPVPGEAEDAAHVQLLGRAAPVDVLLEVPRDDEWWQPASAGAAFRTRLGQHAWRVWGPLLEGAEKVGPL